MRYARIAVGVLVAFCLVAGCGGGGSDKVSPEESKSVLEELKKVDRHDELRTGKKPASSKK